MAFNAQYFGNDGLMPVYEGDEQQYFGSLVEVEGNIGNEKDMLSDIDSAAILAAENEGDRAPTWPRIVIGGVDTASIPRSSAGGNAPPSEDGTLFSDSGFVSREECEWCNERYKNPSLRKKHIYKHIKPHKCFYPGCRRGDEGFATTNDRDRHIKHVHKEGPQVWYRCAYPQCDKTEKDHFFDRRDNFIAHIKRRHDNLQTSPIENLVKVSEYIPTSEEVYNARQAKNGGPSRTPSGRGTNPRAVKKWKARSERSDSASVCSFSPVEGSSSSQPLNIPARAPELPYPPDFSFNATNDMAGIGGAAEMPQSRAVSDRIRSKQPAIPFGRGQQSLQPRSPSASHSFDFHAQRLSHGQRRPGRQAQALTSAPQELFQAIPHDQYTASRSFSSSLSSQLQHQHPASFPTMYRGFSDAMQDLHARRQTQPAFPPGGAYPGMIQSFNDYRGDSAFSPCGSSQVSLSPAFDAVLRQSEYSRPLSSSSYNQSFDVGNTAPAHHFSSTSSSFDPLQVGLQDLDLEMDLGMDLGLDLGMDLGMDLEIDPTPLGDHDIVDEG